MNEELYGLQNPVFRQPPKPCHKPSTYRGTARLQPCRKAAKNGKGTSSQRPENFRSLPSNNRVILSAAETSRSEVLAQSKDPNTPSPANEDAGSSPRALKP